MKVLITTAQVPFIRGGAEILADGLLAAIRSHGHEVEIAAIPFKWYPPERITDHVLACRLLDITESNGQSVDRVIGLKFPAYLIPHPNKVLWLLHQHRPAYDLWDHPLGDLILTPNGSEVRDAIHRADNRGIPEARHIYTISQTVTRRLKHYNDIEATTLYHPPAHAEEFCCGEARDYFFFPGRVCAIKRQGLMLEALAKTRNKEIKVKFTGAPDTPEHLEMMERMAARLHVAHRVEWLGSTPFETRRDLFAHAIGVVFLPVDEDYGYVTLEAMLASKPVITATDCGGPLEFVEHGVTGMIMAPDPEAVAAAMDELWLDRAKAAKLGMEGRRKYDALGFSWDNVVTTLLA